MTRVECQPTETIVEVEMDDKGNITGYKQVQRPCQTCGGRGFYYQ